VRELATIPKWARRVHRVLKNLHPALVDYKGLTRYRDAVVEWLAPHDDGAPTTPAPRPSKFDARHSFIFRRRLHGTQLAHSVLADRHRALGSKLEDWNGMGTAWTYDKDVAVDHVAIRTKAGLMDVSGLKKLHLVGPHAAAVLNYATTRDVTKIYPGKSVYACMLNEAGHFIEDCVLYRTGPNAWMVVHGSGAGHETLAKYVVGRNAAMIVDDDLHDLSLQGPIAVDFLAKHVPGIRDLKYFHHMPATLFGKPVLISRPATPASAATNCSARLRMRA
jgi:hypothetical protein